MNIKSLLLTVCFSMCLVLPKSMNSMGPLLGLLGVKKTGCDSKSGNNPIHQACIELSPEKLKEALKKYSKGKSGEAQELLRKNVVYKNNFGETPLSLALSQVDNKKIEKETIEDITKIVKALLPFYKSDNMLDENKALYYASLIASPEIAKLLYLNGAQISGIMSLNSKEFVNYYKIINDYDLSDDKISFMQSKRNKLDKDQENMLIEICYCRSVCDIVDRKCKFNETVFYKIFDKQNCDILTAVLSKNSILRFDLLMTAIEFKTMLEQKFASQEPEKTGHPQTKLVIEFSPNKDGLNKNQKHGKTKSQEQLTGVMARMALQSKILFDLEEKHKKTKSLDLPVKAISKNGTKNNPKNDEKSFLKEPILYNYSGYCNTTEDIIVKTQEDTKEYTKEEKMGNTRRPENRSKKQIDFMAEEAYKVGRPENASKKVILFKRKNSKTRSQFQNETYKSEASKSEAREAKTSKSEASKSEENIKNIRVEIVKQEPRETSNKKDSTKDGTKNKKAIGPKRTLSFQIPAKYSFVTEKEPIKKPELKFGKKQEAMPKVRTTRAQDLRKKAQDQKCKPKKIEL